MDCSGTMVLQYNGASAILDTFLGSDFCLQPRGDNTRGGLCLIALWPVQFRFSVRSELLMISSYRVNPHVTRF